MITANFKCLDCNTMTEVTKYSIKDEFTYPICHRCAKVMSRVWSPYPLSNKIGQIWDKGVNNE